jgi:hypothetical protein
LVPSPKNLANFSIETEYAMHEKQYGRVDEHGVMRVGTTRVMLDALVAGFEQGHAPETIQQQFPALNLEAHVQGVRLNHAIFFSRGEAS